MPEAFNEAALRHWDDAELLQKQGRIPNADQLYGFATECALKTALSVVPSALRDGRLLPKYLKHVDDLWGLIPLHSGIHTTHPNVVTILRSPTKPFDDWRVEQRYDANDAVSPETCERHRGAARRVLGAVGLLGSRREA